VFISRVIDNPDCRLFGFLNPITQIPGYSLKVGHDNSLPKSTEFIIQQSS